MVIVMVVVGVGAVGAEWSHLVALSEMLPPKAAQKLNTLSCL